MVPIADRHNDYAYAVADRMKRSGLRVEVNDASERMNAKIRDAQLQKINYMLVVGDREIEADSAALRTRTGENLGAIGVDEIIGKLTGEVESMAL